eukprot:jgi/Ulvmu1/5334/UM022_0128.1
MMASDSFCSELAANLVEACPDKVAEIFAADLRVCRSFCKDTNRAVSWFQHFSVHGLRHFEKGARPLANYALKHRGEMWHSLRWTGRELPPNVVANKPGQFAELDVPKTLKALLYECPEFFWSPEFKEACADPQWVSTSPDFFAAEVEAYMRADCSGRRSRAGQLLARLIAATDHAKCSTWCLSHLPPDSQVAAISQCLPSSVELSLRALPRRQAQVQDWLVFGAVPWPTRRQMLVAHACGCGAAGLLRRMRTASPELWQQLQACGAAALPWPAARTPPFVSELLEGSVRVRCVAEPKELLERLACAVAWVAWCGDARGWDRPAVQDAFAPLQWTVQPAASNGQAPADANHAGDESAGEDPMLLMAQHAKRGRRKHKHHKRKRRRRSPAAAKRLSPFESQASLSDVPAAAARHCSPEPAAARSMTGTQQAVTLRFGGGDEVAVTHGEALLCVALAGVVAATVHRSGGPG